MPVFTTGAFRVYLIALLHTYICVLKPTEMDWREKYLQIPEGCDDAQIDVACRFVIWAGQDREIKFRISGESESSRMETKFGDIYHLIKVILIRLGTTEETSSSTGSRINHSEWLTFSRLEGPRAFVFAFIPYLVTSENYKAYKLDEGNKCERKWRWSSGKLPQREESHIKLKYHPK